MNKRLYPSKRIRHATIDSLTVIMDLKTDSYHTFDHQASFIFEKIIDADGDLALAFARYQQEFRGETRILDSRFERFVLQCIDLGFLTAKPFEGSDRNAPASPRPARLQFLSLQAWLSLFLTGSSIKLRGFGRTYEKYNALSCALGLDNSDRLLQTALAAFLRAENFISFANAPDDCLPRSLALFRFLRSIGFPVIHRIGGRRFPTLTMHAWVEYNGMMLLDDSREIEHDIVLASITD